MLRQAITNNSAERETRIRLGQDKLVFGIKYLDDCLRGIHHSDLVLIGARSGAGKTQLATLIAEANVKAGKRVDLFALEASEHEIEQRIKYRIFSSAFFADHARPRDINLNFPEWLEHGYGLILERYETEAFEKFRDGYAGLFIYNRGSAFDVQTLVQACASVEDRTDLIIIDHAHYFDFEDDNENRALKKIAQTVRHISLDMNKPIVLIGHIRKSDRNSTDAAPGMEEFHGSSDLFKIATKIVTVASGNEVRDGTYETFFRTPKNRIDGTSQSYLGQCFFDPRIGKYADGYLLGKADQKRGSVFEELPIHARPRWSSAPAPSDRSNHHANTPRTSVPNYAPKRNWRDVTADP